MRRCQGLVSDQITHCHGKYNFIIKNFHQLPCRLLRQAYRRRRKPQKLGTRSFLTDRPDNPPIRRCQCMMCLIYNDHYLLCQNIWQIYGIVAQTLHTGNNQIIIWFHRPHTCMLPGNTNHFKLLHGLILFPDQRGKFVKLLRRLLDQHRTMTQPDHLIPLTNHIVKQIVHTGSGFSTSCRHRQNSRTTIFVQKVLMHRLHRFFLIRIQCNFIRLCNGQIQRLWKLENTFLIIVHCLSRHTQLT